MKDFCCCAQTEQRDVPAQSVAQLPWFDLAQSQMHPSATQINEAQDHECPVPSIRSLRRMRGRLILLDQMLFEVLRIFAQNLQCSAADFGGGRVCDYVDPLGNSNEWSGFHFAAIVTT